MSPRFGPKGYLASVLAPMLRKIGAVKVSETREEYEITTILGDLFIAIYDDWVHCCFENVEAAKQHFGHVGISANRRLNPHSGKWNWHWFDVNPDVLEKRYRTTKGHLKLLAETVWREIEDLTPAAVEAHRKLLAELAAETK